MIALFTGLVMIVAGVVLFIQGSNMNDDLGQQIQSILTSGTKNPGSPYMTMGIVVGVIGLILFVVGIVLLVKKSQTSEEVAVHPFEQLNNQTSDSFFCPFCGAENDSTDAQCRCCKKNIAPFQK